MNPGPAALNAQGIAVYIGVSKAHAETLAHAIGWKEGSTWIVAACDLDRLMEPLGAMLKEQAA